MSETEHQSFYEIQLNTSHLLVVFLGAVLVGVTIFYLGVVIGRGDSGPVVPADWEAATPAGDEAGGEEDLGFYDSVREPTEGGEEPAAEAEANADPARDPVAVDDGAEPSEPPVTTPSRPAVEPTSTEQPSAPASGLPEPDPGLAVGWVVQVRSTTEKAAADQLQTVLVRDGFQAFVVSTEIDGTTWYRVRVGRYASRAEADRVEAALARRGDIETTWVTEG